jgi:hypothetical protein
MDSQRCGSGWIRYSVLIRNNPSAPEQFIISYTVLKSGQIRKFVVDHIYISIETASKSFKSLDATKKCIVHI